MWCQMEANGFPNTLAGGRTAGPWPSKEIKSAFFNIQLALFLTFTGFYLHATWLHVLYCRNDGYTINEQQNATALDFSRWGCYVSASAFNHVCVQNSGHPNKDGLCKMIRGSPDPWSLEIWHCAYIEAALSRGHCLTPEVSVSSRAKMCADVQHASILISREEFMLAYA